MRILITGGAGFIGSHLAERLLANGHEVTIVDARRRSDWPRAVRSIAGHDIYIQYASRGYLEPGLDRWDFIYHLASTVGVKRVLEDPRECMDNNIESLKAVLSLGIPGLFTSTSEVYGKSTGPLSEDSDLIMSSKARWSYAASKLIGEWMAKQAGWKVVRLFNVVGPRQNSEYGAVLPNFVRQALAGEPLTVYGSGDQVRTFIDVRDCVEILDRLREKEFDLVNVGGTNQLSIRELASKVRLAFCAEGFVHSLINRQVPYSCAYGSGFEECPERIPNLSKLDSLLPERPSTDFSKTIRDLAESLKPQEVTA